MGMIEGDNRVSFALESLAGPLNRELNRDVTIETRVASLSNFAHPTCANVRDELLRSKTPANRQDDRLGVGGSTACSAGSAGNLQAACS
jgi:hypothetical protein